MEHLFDLAGLVERIFIFGQDRVLGCWSSAAYLYVEEVDPDAGRLTKDIDMAVRQADLGRIAKAAEAFAIRPPASPRLRSRYARTVRTTTVSEGGPLVLTGEKVRPEYSEPTPECGPYLRIKGLRLIPLADLVRMKLTSFRASDEAHLKHLDGAGLIPPEVEPGFRRSWRAGWPRFARAGSPAGKRDSELRREKGRATWESPTCCFARRKWTRFGRRRGMYSASPAWMPAAAGFSALPPSELGVHPAEGPTCESGVRRQVSSMCDDIHATVAELRANGIRIDGEATAESYGITVMMTLPGGVIVMLYEPRRAMAIRPRQAGAPGETE